MYDFISSEQCNNNNFHGKLVKVVEKSVSIKDSNGEFKEIGSHGKPIKMGSFLDKDTFVTCSEDHKVKRWNISSLKQEFEYNTNLILNAVARIDTNNFATGGDNKEVLLFDGNNDKLFKRIIHNERVKLISGSGSRLIFADTNKKLYFYK